MIRLRCERETRGWSRAELARRANLNAATVGLIEAGRLRPYPSQLVKLALALGVPELEAPTLIEQTRPSAAPPSGSGASGSAHPSPS